jgi:hypothetical protein
MEHAETQDEAAADVLDAVRSAAFVFYADGHWRPFADDTPESRVTKPSDTTHVQFNSLPGRPPHAEYRTGGGGCASIPRPGCRSVAPSTCLPSILRVAP